MRRLFSTLLFLIFCQPAVAQSPEQIQIQFELDGLERRFTLFTPENLDDFTGPRPLIVVIHGIASTDKLVIEKSSQTFNRLAAEFGFVVAYPNGLTRAWDLDEGIASSLLIPRRNDLKFIEQVIAVTAERVQVDSNRIFAAGFSLGGQMGFALACKRPGLLRAIATVAMPLPGFLQDDCRTGPPLGVALFHGTDDAWVPYNGGTFPIGLRARDNYLSHEHTVQYFLRRNGCDADLFETRFFDEKDDKTSVLQRSWTDCDDAPVISYTIIGGGHAWPPEKQVLGRPFVGRVSQEIDAAAQAWALFQTFE